ncbi:PepSY domain-containing protein [uncultured Paraglaciecola sp.]|uniref:PepSY domain-containing protein n=1 Tax=uncultured Paraglaciecola sp. TaxID=1765024 RepID=UPI0030D86138|tara:strand:- start:22031 stop:22549 length:519 start_codon:yes stop_codon:yes gene_type:complete
MASPKLRSNLRQYHRWLGFFLSGIMAVYAISGILLIFRNTDVLKFQQQEQRQLVPQLSAKALGDELRFKGFAVLEQNATTIVFKQGHYDKTSGVAVISRKDYPKVLQQLVNLHKATTDSPLYWLNISFGLSLLFFVVSAFIMFLPKTKVFKNGLKIAGIGFVFAILVLIYGS